MITESTTTTPMTTSNLIVVNQLAGNRLFIHFALPISDWVKPFGSTKCHKPSAFLQSVAMLSVVKMQKKLPHFYPFKPLLKTIILMKSVTLTLFISRSRFNTNICKYIFK